MEATHRFRSAFDHSVNHIGKRQMVGYALQGMLLVSAYIADPVYGEDGLLSLEDG
jgi:hypothetical protein